MRHVDAERCIGGGPGPGLPAASDDDHSAILESNPGRVRSVRRWEAAKRIARVSATLDTELGNHLGQCHMNVEQNAIAAHRNLHNNPVRWLPPATPAGRGADQPDGPRVPGKEAPWFERSERMDLDEKAAEPPLPAVSAVPHSDVPESGALDALKQLCRYVIFFATFRHAWANNLEWEDAGEIRYACLGLRWGKGEGLPDEDDPDVAPPPDQATEMLWISWMLSKTSYGVLLANEEGDVHPRLVELLRARTAELAALGLDVQTVSSRINL
jgi:hypothetical protein